MQLSVFESAEEQVVRFGRLLHAALHSEYELRAAGPCHVLVGTFAERLCLP